MSGVGWVLLDPVFELQGWEGRRRVSGLLLGAGSGGVDVDLLWGFKRSVRVFWVCGRGGSYWIDERFHWMTICAASTGSGGGT